MKIEEYIKTNEDFDIFDQCELEFANHDESKEAEENILWAIEETRGMKPLDVLQAIAVVVKSYHGGVVEWERY